MTQPPPSQALWSTCPHADAAPTPAAACPTCQGPLLARGQLLPNLEGCEEGQLLEHRVGSHPKGRAHTERAQRRAAGDCLRDGARGVGAQ